MYDLKSKVIDIYDYRKVVLDGVLEPFQIDEEDIEEETEALRKEHSHTIEADSVQPGDIAEIACSSSESRFNREKITLKVGLGLFSKEIESKIVGMKVGETALIDEKKVKVNVKVLKATRVVLPELNDENVSQWGLENVSSVDELRNCIKAKLKKQYIDDIAESFAIYIQNQANEKSVFELNSEELAEQEKEGNELALGMMRSQGLDPDTATDAEVQQAMGKTKTEHMEFLKEACISSFKSGLVGLSLMEQTGKELTDKDYDRYISEYMAATGADMDQAKNIVPFDKYIIAEGANYYLDIAEEYAREYLARG